jgi:hypothetical protein
VVNKVRGKLSSLDRKTLSALIVIDVHARDVVSALVKEGVATTTDFSWISQLRCARHVAQAEGGWISQLKCASHAAEAGRGAVTQPALHSAGGWAAQRACQERKLLEHRCRCPAAA